jgi:hypothetical protein
VISFSCLRNGVLSLSLPSYMDQLNQILYYLGNPSEEALGRVGSARVSYSIVSIIHAVFIENKNNRRKIISELSHLKNQFLL